MPGPLQHLAGNAATLMAITDVAGLAQASDACRSHLAELSMLPPHDFHSCFAPEGIGGRIAGDLKGLGVTTAAGLQQLSEQRLAALPSVRPAMAATLAGWAHGRDSTSVVDKGPPKSLQVRLRHAE
jgi:hypothetical protein